MRGTTALAKTTRNCRGIELTKQERVGSVKARKNFYGLAKTSKKRERDNFLREGGLHVCMN
jgi:hypothetical protein